MEDLDLLFFTEPIKRGDNRNKIISWNTVFWAWVSTRSWSLDTKAHLVDSFLSNRCSEVVHLRCIGIEEEVLRRIPRR